MRLNRVALNLILLGIPILFFIFPPTQPYMIVALGLVCHSLLWFLDCVFGTHVLHLDPIACWLLVGGIFGGTLGFWTVAPSIGKRHLRKLAAIIPLILLTGLTCIDITYSMMNPVEENADLPTPITTIEVAVPHYRPLPVRPNAPAMQTSVNAQ